MRIDVKSLNFLRSDMDVKSSNFVAKETGQVGTLVPPDFSSSNLPNYSSQEWFQSLNSAPSPPASAGKCNSTSHGLSPPSAAKAGKKRSRASRRAPTTVLRTDATNFRSMVQEFTGIPSAPETLQGDSKFFHNFNALTMALGPNYSNCNNYSPVPQYYGLPNPLSGSWSDFIRLNNVNLNQQYSSSSPAYKVARTATASRFANLEAVDASVSPATWVNPSMNQIV